MTESNIGKKPRGATVLALTLVVLFGLFGVSVAAESMFFLYVGGDHSEGPMTPSFNRGLPPWVAVLYRYDETVGQLRDVVSFGGATSMPGVKQYTRCGVICVTMQNREGDQFHVFRSEIADEPRTLEESGYSTISRYSCQVSDEGNSYLLVWHERQDARSGPSGPNAVFQISDWRVLDNADTVLSATEPVLGGNPSGYYGRDYDVIPVGNNPGGTIEVPGAQTSLATSAVPAGTVRTEFIRGWNLIAVEPDFLAFAAIPDFSKPLPDTREYLIYHRGPEKWSSLSVEGAETMLRVIGNWLVGVVADPNPRNEPSRRVFYGSVKRNEIVLVNALTLETFIVDLGPMSEVLWIEEDTVWYRSKHDLYRARISGHDFIDREKIFSDFWVGGIHWAFRGKLSSED